MKALINNTSISLKITLGIVAVIVFFFFLSIFTTEKIESLDTSIKELASLTENSVEVLELNKDILELQRMALVYGQAGSESVFRKIDSTYKRISTSLANLQYKITEPKSRQLVINMSTVVQRYGENIQSLKNRYEFKQRLVDKELPAIRQSGTDTLKSIINFAKQYENHKAVDYAQSILQYWLESNIDADTFIKKRQFTIKKRVYENIENINKISKKLRPFLNKETISMFDDYSLLVGEFRNKFDQAVQANRIYLSLVNVVMAGEAVEFTTLANQLREASLVTLKEISEHSKAQAEDSNRIVSIVFLAMLPVILLFALFYNYSISSGIKSITATFDSLRHGQQQEKIPGLDRKDEIGQLAKAANAFKDANDELIKAKREAEELSRVKSEFLANMSHEIRTPMNGVLGMVSLLKGTKLNNEQQEMVETISSSGDSLLTILNDILDLSKAESGKIVLEQKSFSLSDLLNELSFMFVAKANDKNISYLCEIDQKNHPEYIVGDVTRLKQILINLVSNALKFTEQGSVTLKLNCEYYDKNSCMIKFQVIDTGIGIKPEDQANLFKAFSQADTSVTRKYGGTGLGLVISSKLAALMGGSIAIDSQPGKGTTFSFTIDFKLGEKPKNKSISNQLSMIKHNKDLQILLVEDNDVNRTIAIKMLESLGFECDIAEHGKIAVDKVKVKHYDLIFMDMQMPEMDGIEATRQIRQLQSGEDICIVAMTANVMKQDQQKCFDAGMNHFIAKPISFPLLKEFLVEFTEKSKVA